MGVIVTVLNEENVVCGDFELPSDVSITEIAMLLAQIFKGEESSKDEYVLEVKTQAGEWWRLDQTRTLDDCLIMDGAYLRLQKKQIESDTQAFEVHQLQPLSKEKIKESLNALRID